MLQSTTRLVEAIDQIIVKHGSTNPDLTRELQQLRTEVQTLKAKRDATALAGAALRAASWLKFIMDMMDDGP